MKSSDAQERLEKTIIAPDVSISTAIGILDKAGTGALLMCCSDGRLCGLLTDGDIRRAILQGRSLEDPCQSISSAHPITLVEPVTSAEALRVMDQHDINHLPVLDATGLVKALLLRKDLTSNEDLQLSAVIMAGGFGKRLRPLTDDVPKPMLPIGDRPLLELTIARLREAGIKEVNLTTHYLPESIVNHFGNGDNFGVNLNYYQEDNPLGTAGGLKLVKRTEGTLLVLNGDILTGVPFHEFVGYHRKHKAEMTVGVRKYQVKVPFGVVECDGLRVTGLREKPSLSFFINAGTYLVEPSVFDLIPDGRRYDMTDLISKLLELGRTVVSFPIMEYWLDVGQLEDYQKAQADARQGVIP